jgi:hypothetical protein
MATDYGRTFDLDLAVTSFGSTGMLMAKSSQMPNLMVTGTDEEDLFSCLRPVITNLLEANGEIVRGMSIDRTVGPSAIKVHVETTPAQ